MKDVPDINDPWKLKEWAEEQASKALYQALTSIVGQSEEGEEWKRTNSGQSK